MRLARTFQFINVAQGERYSIKLVNTKDGFITRVANAWRARDLLRTCAFRARPCLGAGGDGTGELSEEDRSGQ
jgi:hypothetical protein